MKRMIAILLAMILVCAAACAEGKLTVSGKSLIIYDGDDNGYFYAKVENTGDEPIGVGMGTLVAFNENDDIVFSENYITSSPSYIKLQPGEYTYVSDFIWKSELKTNTVADFKFSMEPYDRGTAYATLPCEASFELKAADSYDSYIYVTFTNTTDDILYGAGIIVALLDADGNVVMTDSDTASSIGIHPGSTLTVKCSIPNDNAIYYAKHGIKPVTVDAKVLYKKD